MLNYIVDRRDRAELAHTLKALSHPKRLLIFDMLMEGVQCNCEIAERLGYSLNLISHHMRILQEAGLVRSEHDPDDARWIYYSVDRDAAQALGVNLARFLDTDRIMPRLPACGPKACNSCQPDRE